MSSDKKKYIVTSITLGLIAASSGLLIGLSNLITSERIVQNEIERVNKGIKSIFGEEAIISKEYDLSGYQYVKYVYEVSNVDNLIGYAFKTSGSNMYGKISLLVGYNASLEFSNISVVTNEQTYASTLVDNYVIPVQEGVRDIDDVTCGATYGAKLIRDMIKEASEVVKEL